jgi:ATP sulfurylase
MVATVEHIRGHLISISLMTTDMFYGRHHDLVNHYIIYISLMTTDMFYGRDHDWGNHYIISIRP